MSTVVDPLSGPIWHNEAVQATDHQGAQCSMWVGNFLFGSWQCEEPSTHIVRGACVHEHVVEYVTCERHGLSDSRVFCNRCTDSAEPHECPLVVSVDRNQP